MKCPKCAYLGFDTSERCKNCGYDFSLIAAEEPAADLDLWSERDQPAGRNWDVDLDARTGPAVSAATPGSASAIGAPAAAAAALSFEPTMPPPSFRGEPALPLFSPAGAPEDEPLIRVPAQPRPPLSVRRTPETPRLRAVPKAVERAVPEPQLNFTEDAAAAVPKPSAAGHTRAAEPMTPSRAGARLVAAAVDHAILLAIDAVVLYLTLRIASLSMNEWRALPILPMGTFLGLLKLAYFTAFTCVGGQTIGKMAAGIRVVGDDDQTIDAPHAIHRALAGAISCVTLGAGFLPALFRSDGRALHDRLAHTRVVVLRAA